MNLNLLFNVPLGEEELAPVSLQEACNVHEGWERHISIVLRSKHLSSFYSVLSSLHVGNCCLLSSDLCRQQWQHLITFSVYVCEHVCVCVFHVLENQDAIVWYRWYPFVSQAIFLPCVWTPLIYGSMKPFFQCHSSLCLVAKDSRRGAEFFCLSSADATKSAVGCRGFNLPSIPDEVKLCWTFQSLFCDYKAVLESEELWNTHTCPNSHRVSL